MTKQPLLSTNISDKCFTKILNYLKTTKQRTTSNETKLKLYGLYKQITKGNVCSSQRPYSYNIRECKKFDSWYSYNHMSRDYAKLCYANLLLFGYCDEMDDGVECVIGDLDRDAILDIIHHDDCIESDSTMYTDETNYSVKGDDKQDISKDSNPAKQSNTYSKRHNGLICRGKLDISHTDLLKTLSVSLFHTLSLPLLPSYYKYKQKQKYEQSITSLFPQNAIIGYSVRNLFYNYLQSSNFPKNASVIITPPIQIPSMVQIIQNIELNVITVDIPSTTSISIDISAIEKKVQENNVIAVFIVHPFGINPIQNNDTLIKLSQEYNFEIWHDCAQSFIHPTEQELNGDLIFYSFGTIKSYTSLQGGIALVSSHEKYKKLKDYMNANCVEQPEYLYLKKIMKCALLQLSYISVYVIGIAGFMCSSWLFQCLFSIDYDTFITYCTQSKEYTTLSSKEYSYLPNTSNLYLLQRRLYNNNTMYYADYINYCKDIQINLSSIVQTLSNTNNRYWLYPVITNDPQSLYKKMLDLGWDMPTGTTQLSCIDDTPNAKFVMDHVLYAPIYYLFQNERSWKDKFLKDLEYATSFHSNTLNQKKLSHKNQL